MTITAGDVVTILKEAASFLTSATALVASVSAWATARSAKQAAQTAHEKASEAVREQITFGLRRVARQTVAEMKGEDQKNE